MKKAIVITLAALVVGSLITGIILIDQMNPPPPRRSVLIATTTSTFDSGLLDYMIPRFENQYGIQVRVIAKGTGEALEIARRGDADLVLVHSRSLEEAFVEEGYGVHRVGIMYNDFIIIGPKRDPAGIRGVDNASYAFQRIAEEGSKGRVFFISRADGSGTYVKETAIWKELNLNPSGLRSSWYVEAGAGMGAVLRLTGEKEAYTLTDRGTWLAFKQQLSTLEVMVEGDTRLFNPYAAILVNPKKHPERSYKLAVAFVKFLVSEEGQRMIGEFQRGGETLFHPLAREYETANHLGFPDQEAEVAWYDEQILSTPSVRTF